MKIGILTQPLLENYGGLLQCYALQTILKRLGHEVWVVQRTTGELQGSTKKVLFSCIKQFDKIFLGEKLIKRLRPSTYAKRNTSYFVLNYINPKTKLITTTETLKKCHIEQNFEAYIVGSDQVWRPIYSPCINNYFLDFLVPQDRTKRIAYAASFGVDEWEFSEEETSVCKDLIKLFDGVSVRENSATALCEKYLGRNDALHVLDPTMLLEKEDYIRIVEKEKEPKSPGNLFCYILDESSEKNQVVESIASQIDAVPFTQMPKCKLTYENLRDRLEDCVYPSVTAWLRAFMDADMVVTDSFHGCVFSIIFNKPFWVIGNHSRGMARFESLLSMFGLEGRLMSTDSIPVELSSPIDWDRVNTIKKDWQEKSYNFLERNL
jgi:hypothetical protein